MKEEIVEKEVLKVINTIKNNHSKLSQLDRIENLLYLQFKYYFIEKFIGFEQHGLFKEEKK